MLFRSTFNVSRKEGVIKLWEDFNGNYKDCFENGTKNFLSGDYCEDYKDFNKLVSFSKKLKNEDYKKIYEELGKYNLHGADFDLFGKIYETFADTKEKKSFGEFYTRRHITKTIAKILLYREEDYKKDLKICDCCCGTGGFLTEAFKVLRNNWNRENNLTSDNKKHLEKDIFFGFDDREESIARTELNMFLVGDGHTNINKRDTLKNFDGKDGLEKDIYDYIISNPPYGNYKGSEKTEDFWSQEKRYEMLFVEKIIKATKRGGRMAIVIPDGILESPSREYFRKKMLSNIDIEIIISLPKFAFAPYTKEKTYVIFAKRKQKESEGQLQKNPIWNYIVDYDGYANSDKRYETKLQGKDGSYLNFDLPELEESFKDKKEIKKEIKGEIVHKSKLVEISEINESNFHNLLSEFHLRPRKINKTDQENFDKRLIEIKDSIKEIGRASCRERV